MLKDGRKTYGTTTMGNFDETKANAKAKVDHDLEENRKKSERLREMRLGHTVLGQAPPVGNSSST